MTSDQLLAAPQRTDTSTPAPRSRGGRIGFSWVVFSAVSIALLATLPYATDSLVNLADGSTVAANYADRPLWVQLVFYAHVVFGGVALLLSPAQFAASLRKRAPGLHRILGRVTFAGIVLGGLAGLVLAPISMPGPVLGSVGFGTLAALWIGYAVAAYRAIRRGDVDAHQRWVIRTFALTYAAVTLRLWLVLLTMAQVIALQVPADAAFHRAYLIVPFLCWVPNLMVAELMVRRRFSAPAAASR